MKELIKQENIDPEEVFLNGGMKPIVTDIAKAVSTFVADVNTAAGRKEIASMARKVARSKTFLENIGKTYVAELKKQPVKVDAERRKMKAYLDKLRDKVRKPLTEWEDAETARVHGLIDRVNIMKLPEDLTNFDLASNLMMNIY